jgi:threonine dehydratase
LTLDDVLVCCSGGGLTAGIAIALARLAPQAGVWTAEPAGHDDHRRSLQTGQRQRNAPDAAASICDALLAPTPGELTFAINQPRLRGGLVASDAEVRAAIAYAARILKLIVEPGGAVALACLLAGRLEARGRTVALTLSGGNIDDALLREILADPVTH